MVYLKNFKSVVLVLTAVLFPTAAQSQLVINELMQSNIDEVWDDQNDFPDSWVELYNPTGEYIWLAGYEIGAKVDKSGNPVNPWRLPTNEYVEPYSHKLIYCDKAYDKLFEDLKFKQGGLSDDEKESLRLHTNFRLESGKGCVVYLLKDGLEIDRVTLEKKQPAPNIAYGREEDYSPTWGYELTPTPGDSNGGGICGDNQILGAPIFSESGFVKTETAFEPFYLILSLPEDSPEGTQIYYTTDGSEPQATPANQYYAPILITNTTIVRAKLFCDGWLSPRSSTQSYISLNHEIKLPVISIATDDAYLNDDYIGIFANNSNDNRRDHDNWRRPINLEYFEAEGGEGVGKLNQLCETRVAGGFSRSFSRKTMIIYANKRFGEKQFEHEFFPDQKPGLKKFKSLMLRNAGNDYDYLYMRDALVQRHMGTHTDLDWEAWRPAIVFINGQYHAMLNIRERSEEDFVESNYGLDDIDLIENWEEDGLKAGDMKNWNAFDKFYRDESVNHTMAEYEKWMDCHEFINLMLMNLFYANLDFPAGNIICWRPRTDTGRWRWIAKDVDYALGYQGGGGEIPSDFNTIEWINNHNYHPWFNWGNNPTWTMLFRQLMKDPTFKNEFADRYAIYAGDFLNYEGLIKTWEPMYAKIKDEIYHFCAAIDSWGLYNNYNIEMSYVKKWASERNEAFTNHLCTKYGFEAPLPLTINTKSDVNALDTLTFNDHRLSQVRYDGRYFRGHPINLKAIPAEDNVITGWKINQDGKETFQAGAELNWMMPACNLLSIEPICKKKGDFDDSGNVDQADINLMVSAVMRTKTDTTDYSEYDLNGDKKVDAADLVTLVSIVYKTLK
jgi:hypothetical protein